MDLFKEIVKSRNAGWDKAIAVGQVTSVSPLEVRFFGDIIDTGVTALSHYTPTTSDKVILVKVGPQWFVVGDF